MIVKNLESEKLGPFHFGLGPFEGSHLHGIAMTPNERNLTLEYDDRYIFNIDGTFTHLTNETVFGFEEYLNGI